MRDHIELEHREGGAERLNLHGENELAFSNNVLVGVTVAGSKFKLDKLPNRLARHHLVELSYKIASPVNDVALARMAYKAMMRGKDILNKEI